MGTFFKWLNNKKTGISSAEEREFTDLEEIWEAAGKREKIHMPDRMEQWQKIESQLSDSKPKGKTISLKFMLRIAASFLLLVASCAIYFTMFNSHTYKSEAYTQQIVLSDGSEVKLNKHSVLVVKSRFNQSSRNVSLSGEAYFKVAKSKYPFIISTELALVKVVGTQFNVKARNAIVELAVNEGTVDFSNINEIDKKVRVTRGFISKCSLNSTPIEPEPIQFTEYPGWMHGRISFQENTLAEICMELELTNGMKIELAVDSLKERVVSGTLEDSKPDEIIKILCSLIQRDYRIEHGKYVIY